MEKNLEKELEEILEKHKKETEPFDFKIENGFVPFNDTNDSFFWTLILFMIIFDKPKEEPKQPVINIYLGGDK